MRARCGARAQVLDFKWTSFARRKYVFDVSFHALRVVLILVWNLMSARHVTDSLDELLQGAFVDFEAEFVLLAALWLYTSTSCLLQARVEMIELLANGCYKFCTDVFNIFDVISIVAQIAINTLFLLRDHVPSALIQRNVTGNAIDYYGRRLYEPDLGAVAFGGELDLAGGGNDVAGRLLRASGGSGGDGFGTDISTDNRPGVYIVLQAIVSLLSFLRLLFYFKGVLRLGALVHTMTRIVFDIIPLAILILVLMVAFWSSIYLLMYVELTEADSPEWHSLPSSFLLFVNMGLYTDIDKKLIHHERTALAHILYHLYMLVVQVVLLNMLIAIMAESNDNVRSVARLVAQFERAQRKRRPPPHAARPPACPARPCVARARSPCCMWASAPVAACSWYAHGLLRCS